MNSPMRVQLSVLREEDLGLDELMTKANSLREEMAETVRAREKLESDVAVITQKQHELENKLAAVYVHMLEDAPEFVRERVLRHFRELVSGTRTK